MDIHTVYTSYKYTTACLLQYTIDFTPNVGKMKPAGIYHCISGSSPWTGYEYGTPKWDTNGPTDPRLIFTTNHPREFSHVEPLPNGMVLAALVLRSKIARKTYWDPLHGKGLFFRFG